MPKYVKDEMNFHIFLNMVRQFQNVTLEQVGEGLYSKSMMKHIEAGERLPEKQMRDRILARMGVPIEDYEDYLPIEEYQQWKLRQELLNQIAKRNLGESEEYLKEYEVYKRQNVVEEQFYETMRFMILQLKNAPILEQRKAIKDAVRFTMPNMEKGLTERVLLSEQELNLLIEYVHLEEIWETFEWKYKSYQDLLIYIERSRLDDFCRAKIYPKASYYFCRIILEQDRKEENLRLGIKICCQAIELLRDSRKLYYFIELVDVLEKLAAEYKICLNEHHREEEYKILQSDLEERLLWRNLILELYKEYEVPAYMEHFCYLYWGMESYCIGDVIRTRRKMFGLTKAQLCDGICSLKTLTRLELKKAKTQMPIVRELFERLGLCPEYIRARVITSDYQVLQLAEKLVWYQNNYKLPEWIECLKELEQKLCMDIPQNKQFIAHSHCLLELQLKKISSEEFIEKMKEVIEYTIPLKYAMKEGKKFLSQEEYTYIRDIGMRLEATNGNCFMNIIKELCEQDGFADIHISTYEFLMEAVISYLGNIKEYKKSDELSIRLAERSLICRRSEILAETIYNNLWNYQQRLLEGEVTEQKYERERELKKCICLSKFNKMEKFIKFFKTELENSVDIRD